jgi:uncharacterized protein (DUF305 family)
MKTFTLAATIALLAATSPTTSQEHPTPDLPAICTADAGTDHRAMGSGGMDMPGNSDAAHQALMSGMDRMNADMMVGGAAADIDVAFICAMIPHHRGAIDMAKAELDHGDDKWARTLAEQVIAAQEKEIADMLAWLEAQPQ